MADDEHVYGAVDNASDLRKIFAAIRDDVAQAKTREELTKLFRRAEYLITLTYSPAWQRNPSSRRRHAPSTNAPRRSGQSQTTTRPGAEAENAAGNMPAAECGKDLWTPDNHVESTPPWHAAAQGPADRH